MEGIRLREWKAGFGLRSQAAGMRGSEVEAEGKEQSCGYDGNGSTSQGVERIIGIEEFNPGCGSVSLKNHPSPRLPQALVCMVHGWHVHG